MAEARTQDALERYRKKRDFSRTREPPGGKVAPGTSLFVVQKHAARRLHYDLRLQFGDTLAELGGAERALARSQGRAGSRCGSRTTRSSTSTSRRRSPRASTAPAAMIVWDRGTWVPMGDPEEGYRKGTLKFRLAGEKLGGGWTLVRLKPKDGERGDNWLLIKERDPFARAGIGWRHPGGAPGERDHRPAGRGSGRGGARRSQPAPRRQAASDPRR